MALTIINNLQIRGGVTVEIEQSTMMGQTRVELTASDTECTFFDTTITYWNTSDNDWKTETMYVSDNTASRTLVSVDDSKEVTIEGICNTEKKPDLNIVNNIDVTGSGTLSITSGYDYPAKRYQITVICSDVNCIWTAPKVEYYNISFNTWQTADMVVTDNQAVKVLTNVDASQPVTLTGSCETEGESGGDTPEIIDNIEKYDSSATYETVTDFSNGILTITLTLDWGTYRFFNCKGTYTGTDGTEKQSDFSTDNDVAVLVLTDVDASKSVTLTGLVDKYMTIENTLDFCTADGYQRTAPYHTPLNITLIANDGYVFKTGDNAPYLKMGGSLVGQTDVPFVFEDGSTVAKLENYTIPDERYQTFTLIGSAEKQTIPATDKHGSINVYVVTDDILEQFAKIRFTDTQDTANYINTLKRVFVKVPTNGTATIKCGNTDTSISAEVPDTAVIVLDFGTVTIPEHNQTSADYQNEIKLFLPFYGFVDIPNEMAGKTIHLQCEIDVITGTGVVKLDIDGIMFAGYEITPSADIIYRTITQQINVVSKMDTDVKYLMGVTPYVFYKWYEEKPPVVNNAGYQVNIAEMRGFFSIDVLDIISTPDMLPDEQEMIYSKLKNGVYVL